MTEERTGVLLLRVWVDDADRRVRARITHVLDISSAEEHVVTAGSVEEIEQAVRAWLKDFSPPGDNQFFATGDSPLTSR